MSNEDSGQSLMEVLIAATIGILIVTALTFATIFSIRNANFAKNSAQATKLAQEGLEKVRYGRNKNECIFDLHNNVRSWNGDSTNSNCPGSGSVWSFQISASSNCENQTTGSKCFFKVEPDGVLRELNSGAGFVPTALSPIPASAETISSGNQTFKRAALLTDEGTGQKKVIVVVVWSDFAGSHKSELVTVLREL